MNLLCPHCQKPLTVPDSQAGQVTQCPNCQHGFELPMLPRSPFATAPAPNPPAPPVPPPPAAEVYSLAPVPPRPAPPKPPSTVPAPSNRPAAPPVDRPAPAAASVAPKLKIAPEETLEPANGLKHKRTYEISHRAVGLIGPVAMSLVFISLFFSWCGFYPGSVGAYTQNPWQMMWGGFSVDTVGDKVLNVQDRLQELVTWSPLMLFFDLLVLLSVALALAPIILGTSVRLLPPNMARLWPWRLLALNLVTATAFVLGGIQSSLGFGLEKAAASIAREEVAESRQGAKTPEENRMADIREGMALGKLEVKRTSFYELGLILHLLALAGMGFQLWLETRKSDLPPRVTIEW